MKTLKKTFALALLGLATVSESEAQDKLNISGEIRPRTEFRNGFKKPMLITQDPAFFTEQRSRLNFEYEGEKFEVKVSFQDIRIWGAAGQVYKTDPSLTNMYEAFGKYKITPKSALSVGRMALDYDNARFLGNLDWAQQGRSHDLILYTFKDSAFQFHLGGAFNQDANVPEYLKLADSTTYSGVVNYKTMQFLWLHKDAGKFGISLLALNNGLEGVGGVNHSQTFGMYAEKKEGVFKATLEAYTQTGKNAAKQNIEAYFLGASATYAKIKKLPLTVGVDYLSGTKSGSKTDGAFNPMYGTNHKFYGFMDYFYVGNAHKNAGLVDIFFQTKIGFTEKSSLVLHVHNFSAAVDVADPTSPTATLASQLGQEIDLVYVLKATKGVVFNLGYSQMFQTTSMDALKGVYGKTLSPFNGWAWMMISFKPTFYSSK